ncbi:MAG TPA: hypothetical protein VNQ48_00815 [Microbacteriaceae bacterium]|nr:hypothetical protein [Microbacteriaceae bacterium]
MPYPAAIRSRLAISPRRCLGVLTAALLLAAVLVVLPPAPPAAAMTDGPGYTDADNGGVGGLGAFLVDGRAVYCLEPGVPVPPGEPADLTYGGWAGLSADDLARLNWAISTVGQSGADADAAAVAMYVWSIAAPAAYHSHGMSGDDWYIGRVPASERSSVRAILASLRAGGATITATPGPSGSAALQLSIDPVDPYVGAVTVTGLAPGDASGVLTLKHGVFDATGTPTLAGAIGGGSYAVTGIPPAGAAPYRISATGDFVWTSGWRGELAVYTTPGHQAIAGPGRAPAVAFALAASDPADRTTTFLPTLSTVAARDEVGPGERFEDRLVFGLQPDAAGVVGRWYRDPVTGAHLALNASCRVYGPFPSPPTPAPAPPPGSPFVTSFIVTTGPDGPFVDYLAASEEPLEAPGWYTAWCSIDRGSQPLAARDFLPTGYRFADGFGVPAETIRLVLPAAPELAVTGLEDPRPMLLAGSSLGGIGVALLAGAAARARRQPRHR